MGSGAHTPGPPAAGEQQIVLARTVEDFRVAPGPLARIDLGEQRRIEHFDRPEALVWLRKGTEADVAKARAYAAGEGYSVLLYPLAEKDPLGSARAALAKARPGEEPSR